MGEVRNLLLETLHSNFSNFALGLIRRGTGPHKRERDLKTIRVKLFGGTVPPVKILSGKEKVIYQMKNLGFRL